LEQLRVIEDNFKLKEENYSFQIGWHRGSRAFVPVV